MPLTKAEKDNLLAQVNALVPDAPTVTTDEQTQEIPCDAGYTGTKLQKRTVTTTDGVADDPSWTDVSNTCVLIPPPLEGKLKFIKSYPTNVGAPAGTQCWFGKHTQWAYCSVDGKLYAFGGDGDWRLQDLAFKQNQSLTACVSYNFAADGLMEQITPSRGDPADGTAPYKHDGCTWGYNSQEDKFYGIPGYQPDYKAENDPHQIMRALYVVHSLERQTGKWVLGPSSRGVWYKEHWGGCYDSTRNRFWLQCPSTSGAYGNLRWFDCTATTWGLNNLKQTPGLASYPGIAFALSTAPWCQRYNPTTDEIIVFDGYRGHVIAIPLSGLPSPVPRIVADVPRLLAQPGTPTNTVGEPVGTIENGFCLSIKRQKAFISYNKQNKYVAGGIGGVVAVDLVTGAIDHADYPTPPGPDEGQWTQAEYDDTNDCLILAGNINTDHQFGKTFLRYEFKEPV